MNISHELIKMQVLQDPKYQLYSNAAIGLLQKWAKGPQVCAILPAKLAGEYIHTNIYIIEVEKTRNLL